MTHKGPLMTAYCSTCNKTLGIANLTLLKICSLMPSD